MKIFKIIPLGIFILLSAGPGFSATLEELLGPERAAELISRETLTGLQYKNPQPLLVPRNSFIRQLIGEAMEALGPSLFVESLSQYRKPAGAAAGTWSEAERTALYNGALALSTLEGIQYFSSSRNRMRTFYESSGVIDSPDTKRALADPVYGSPPAELTIYARQKDLTFGDNIYQYQYYARPDSLVFVQENLTVLNAGPIPVVGRNKLRSVVAVIDAGDCLLVYVASMAKAASFPGMNERAGRSFSTRAEAVLTWFSGQADNAFAAARRP
ncbi:MAG: hypothetical protein LBP93_09595 [Treponema sp.]|jgi:hypothetical protein|nr:hypothetical protein [Treponema sp.]